MMLLFSVPIILLYVVSQVQASPCETTDIRFLYQCVDEHNELRRNAGISSRVDYDPKMQSFARVRAQKAASGKLIPLNESDCILENSAFVPSVNETISCRHQVSSWFHKSQNDKISKAPVHVQLSSSKSAILLEEYTRIGCARFMVEEPVIGSYIVCNYGLSSGMAC